MEEVFYICPETPELKVSTNHTPKNQSLLEECNIWRNKIIQRVQKLRDPKGLNILLVGPPGSGKSSFLNSVAAALSGEWHEHAYSGKHGNPDHPVTGFVKRYSQCAVGDVMAVQALLPGIIDSAGLPNDSTSVIQELLRCLCSGLVPDEESVLGALGDGQDQGAELLRRRYNHVQPEMKVQRLVFVTSASQPIPEKLIQGVMKSARPCTTSEKKQPRNIPVFGLMTHADRMTTPYDQRELSSRQQRFMDCLGLTGSKHRFALCRNYCDDETPDRTLKTYPEIDLGILKFIYTILDPAYKADEPAERHVAHSNPNQEHKGDDARLQTANSHTSRQRDNGEPEEPNCERCIEAPKAGFMFRNVITAAVVFLLLILVFFILFCFWHGFMPDLLADNDIFVWQVLLIAFGTPIITYGTCNVIKLCVNVA